LRRIVFLLVALSLIGSLGCTKREDLVVAEVGGKKITVADFENDSRLLEDRFIPDTGGLEAKKGVLKHMINKEVMAYKAVAAGYEKEDWFLRIWDRFKNPYLIASMMDQLVRKKVTVTEQEIDDYYEKMHYEYTVSQILVTSEEQALEIRQMIIEGADFAEMAKKYSMGAEASNGGYIGSNNIGRIHWWVEEALFGASEGDITQPLKASTGYTILKVHRIRKSSPIGGRDYAEKRTRAIKEKKGIEQLKTRIEEEIGLEFFPEAVRIAYESLPEDVPFDDVISYKVTRENAPKPEIPEKYKDMIICQYSDSSFTLRDFEALYEAYGLPERPRREQGHEGVILAMHKKVFNDVLVTYAEEKSKILEIPEVAEGLRKKKEGLLVQHFYEEQIWKDIMVMDFEIEEYYAENKDNLSTAEKRNFSIFVSPDKETAELVAQKAKAGENFTKLISKHTENKDEITEDGKTGLTIKGRYPGFDGVAFSLPNVGDVSDVFHSPRGWSVIKIEEIIKPRIPTLSEAARKIRKILKEKKAAEILDEKMIEWSEEFDIRIHDKNLEKAEIKRNKDRPEAEGK